MEIDKFNIWEISRDEGIQFIIDTSNLEMLAADLITPPCRPQPAPPPPRSSRLELNGEQIIDVAGRFYGR